MVYRDIVDRQNEDYDIERGDVRKEKERLHLAFEKVIDDLDHIATQVAQEFDDTASQVFEAHKLMLQDPTLIEGIESEIEDALVGAGRAARFALRRMQRRFAGADHEQTRHKADDLMDLQRRLIHALSGVHGRTLEEVPEGSIVIARRLLPSDVLSLMRGGASGAALERGGRGSHAALFARESGLPCISQVADLMGNCADGDLVLIDAENGEVTLNPSQATHSTFRERSSRLREAAGEARQRASSPAIAKDGRQVPVLANVGSRRDTEVAMDNGADGIGLFRIELAYLDRQTPPSESELSDAIREVIKPAKDLPVCIRLLDVGADKTLPYVDSSVERNPALGCRGVRFLKAFPKLLTTQLNALLKLSREFSISLLVPMVSLPEDMDFVREELLRCAETLGIRRSEIPELGAMIETPAAALSAATLTSVSDFLSVGTNDLTQYAFAVDRENSSVDDYFIDSHEVIFRMVELLREDTRGKRLSVCGELAGHPDSTARLLKLGVDILSVAPPLIPDIKEAVRK